MDWFLSVTTILITELTVRKKWYVWILRLINQVFWFIYVIRTDQLGLLPMNIVMTWQYIRGLYQWKRQEDNYSKFNRGDNHE